MPLITILNKNKLIIKKKFYHSILVGKIKPKNKYPGSVLRPSFKENNQLSPIFQVDSAVLNDKGIKIDDLTTNEIILPYDVRIQALPRPDHATIEESQFALMHLRSNWQMIINNKKCPKGGYIGVDLVWSNIFLRHEQLEIDLNFTENERDKFLGNDNSPLPLPFSQSDR